MKLARDRQIGMLSLQADTGQCGWYSAEDVNAAPEGTGVYAWYGVPSPGSPDYETLTKLIEFVERHTERLSLPPLAATASGDFWAEWQGELSETGMERVASSLTSADEGAGPTPLQSEAARELFTAGLVRSAPYAASPLYIGVATTLRERLGGHVSDVDAAFRKYRRLGELGPEDMSSFGARAVAAGFRRATLWAATCEIQSSDIDEVAARRIAESLEWVLNRWYRPRLGRK